MADLTKLPTKEERDALRATHLEIFQISVPDVADMDGNKCNDVVLVRRPKEAEVERFFAEIRSGDDGRKHDATPMLARATRVWPDDEAFAAMVKRRPAIVISIGNKLQEIAGLVEETVVKKA